MNNIEIRHSRPSDLPGIKKIYEQEDAFSNTLQLPYPSDAKWQERLTNTSDRFISLVASDGGEIVGHLTLEIYEHPRRKHVATFGMAVSDVSSGRGIGSRLLAAALDLTDNWLNVKRVEIEVFIDNAAAIALYTKFGFEIEGTCRMFAFRNGRYVDVYVMGRLSDC